MTNHLTESSATEAVDAERGVENHDPLHAPPTTAEQRKVENYVHYLKNHVRDLENQLRHLNATGRPNLAHRMAELIEATRELDQLIDGEPADQAVAATAAAPTSSELSPGRHVNPPKELLLSSVVTAVARRLESVSEEDLAHIDPMQVAERAAALIPTPHPFAKLGPFYPTSAVTKWLGLSRQALDQRVKARKLLGCPTSDGGQRVYPVWQFTTDGRPIPHLAEVLNALHQGLEDPWSWATWLAAPVPGRFGGWPAHRWLSSGRDAEPVLTEAHRTASRLAH